MTDPASPLKTPKVQKTEGVFVYTIGCPLPTERRDNKVIMNLSKWLNSRARMENMSEIKAALQELASDPQFQGQFQQLEFRDRWVIARDMVNLQRGKYQEWRMWGLVLAGLGTAVWKILAWWLSK